MPVTIPRNSNLLGRWDVLFPSGAVFDLAGEGAPVFRIVVDKNIAHLCSSRFLMEREENF
jgi:hypothetical protein